MQIVGQSWLNLVTWTCGHEVKLSMIYISWSSDCFLYLEDYLMYVRHTLEYESV